MKVKKSMRSFNATIPPTMNGPLSISFSRADVPSLFKFLPLVFGSKHEASICNFLKELRTKLQPKSDREKASLTNFFANKAPHEILDVFMAIALLTSNNNVTDEHDFSEYNYIPNLIIENIPFELLEVILPEILTKPQGYDPSQLPNGYLDDLLMVSVSQRYRKLNKVADFAKIATNPRCPESCLSTIVSILGNEHFFDLNEAQFALPSILDIMRDNQRFYIIRWQAGFWARKILEENGSNFSDEDSAIFCGLDRQYTDTTIRLGWSP